MHETLGYSTAERRRRNGSSHHPHAPHLRSAIGPYVHTKPDQTDETTRHARHRRATWTRVRHPCASCTCHRTREAIGTSRARDVYRPAQVVGIRREHVRLPHEETKFSTP